MNSKKCILIILVLIALIEIIYLLKSPIGYGFPGSTDFIQYWSALKLLQNGQNPYDAELLLEMQQRFGYLNNVPLMMWLPPWALNIFRPLMLLSYNAAFICFLLVNITLLILSTYLLQRIFSDNKKFEISTCLLALLFFPAWDCIIAGQITIVLVFCLSITYFLLRRNRLIEAGLFVVALSFKPQLFIFITLALLSWALNQRKFNFLYSALLFLSTLIFTTYLENNDITAIWIKSMLNAGSAGSIKTTEWAPATIGTWLRLIINKDNALLMWFPSLIGIIIFLILNFKKKFFSIERDKALALITSISLLLSPYAWFYDQSLLLVCQVFLYYRSGLKVIIALELAYLILKLIPTVHQEHFAIMLPIWTFAIYCSSTGKSSKSSAESSGENCCSI